VQAQELEFLLYAGESAVGFSAAPDAAVGAGVFGRTVTSPFEWLPAWAWNGICGLGHVPSCADLGSDMVSSGERQWREWYSSPCAEKTPMPQVRVVR
jgi:hypothetical protein